VGRLGYEIADCSVETINPSTVNNIIYSYSHFASKLPFSVYDDVFGVGLLRHERGGSQTS